MLNRDILESEFRALTNNVYFQPPANVRMQYPAIRYSLDRIQNRHADNRQYHQDWRYKTIYITKDPDDVNIEALAKLPYCIFQNMYVVDNLYHYTYFIYNDTINN